MINSDGVLELDTPRWMYPLLEPARYKGVYGGRGSGKSHAFAELMIERCATTKTHCVCVREVQQSLAQSVKKLLELKIQALGVGHLFEIQYEKIIGKNGSLIIFQGMASTTAESIKSLEGFDIAWVEEAQSLSQRSLDLLRPTIRKEGSELWFSWNPDKATDPIDSFLRAETLPNGAIVIQANYKDNPWLPSVLMDELSYDQRRDPDKFAHVWLGEYQRNSEARVFKNWTISEFERPEGTIFRYGADWGFSVDPSVLVRCSIDEHNLYVDYEAWQIGCEINNLPTLFMGVPDSEKWPIIADSARPETISYMQKNGFPKIVPAIKGARSLEEGVEFMKSFDIIVHPRCKHLIDELTLYSYKTDPLTNQVMPLLADKDNHCIVGGTLISTLFGYLPIESIQVGDLVLTRNGYKKVLFSGETDQNRDTVQVLTTDGSITCTPDHKIFTSNKGFVRADALSYNDEVVIDSDFTSWFHSLRTLGLTTGGNTIDTLKAIDAQTVCISKEEILICIDKYGKMHMGQYPDAITSTTLMGILSIMQSTTWRVYPRKSILAGMNGAMSEKVSKPSIWSEYAPSRKNGIEAKKVGRSIGKLVHCLISNLSLRLSNAKNAVGISILENLGILTNIAVTPVNHAFVESPVSMMNRGYVYSAGNYMSATSTAGTQFAAGRVLTVIEARKASKVYDLTVEGEHEFFAGGILVHNCIDATRYAVEGIRRATVTKRRVVNIQPPAFAHVSNGWMGS